MNVLGVDYDSHFVHFANLTGDVLSLFRCPVETTLVKTIDNITSLLTLRRPTLVVIEAPIYIQNPKTSFKLVQVHTLIRVACERKKFRYEIVSITAWKKLTFGYAKLKKQEVFELMKTKYGEIISDNHYADAAAMSVAGKVLLEAKDGIEATK